MVVGALNPPASGGHSTPTDAHGPLAGDGRREGTNGSGQESHSEGALSRSSIPLAAAFWTSVKRIL